LISAQFVRPIVKSNKNDHRNAEAIAKAVERENMGFAPIKAEDLSICKLCIWGSG
jgi:transposase